MYLDAKQHREIGGEVLHDAVAASSAKVGVQPFKHNILIIVRRGTLSVHSGAHFDLETVLATR